MNLIRPKTLLFAMFTLGLLALSTGCVVPVYEYDGWGYRPRYRYRYRCDVVVPEPSVSGTVIIHGPAADETAK